MKILLFHPGRLPVVGYGGTERVVMWLARGLVERGHEVWLAAFAGSQPPPGVRLFEVNSEDPSFERSMRNLPPGLDLVHFHAPPGQRAIESLGRSYFVTVHGNGKPGEIFPEHTAFLSKNHAARHGSSVFVYNGIDPDECLFEPKKQPWYLFLSKTSWRVKNVADAVNFCREAGVPLKVAGGQRPWWSHLKTWAYGRETRSHWEWVGEVGGQIKKELLSQARGLIFPILWDEPFGLVVVEALASGTPVIATDRGSLGELVRDPRLGVLLKGPRECPGAWIEQLREGVHLWDAEACRAEVLQRFHYRIMAENYEILYRKALTGGLDQTGRRANHDRTLQP